MSEAEKYQKSLYRPQKQKNAAAKGVVPGITKSTEQSSSEDQSYAKRKQLDDSNQHSKKSKIAGSKHLLTVIKTTAKELLEKV
jgi:hypothetical protein